MQASVKEEKTKLENAWNAEDKKQEAKFKGDLVKEEARVTKEAQDAMQFPVNMVSWYDAMEFCRRLSEMPEEKAVGRCYRLPTEAEWEYAGRGGDASPEADDPELYKRYRLKPKAVGSGTPNAFGLYDMSENVYEWCSDWYLREYYAISPADDPQGPTNGALKVSFGGVIGFFEEIVANTTNIPWNLGELIASLDSESFAKSGSREYDTFLQNTKKISTLGKGLFILRIV